ncbi:MAG: hypothetical protein WBQ94_04365 [Terracidiphilus sp.]
MALQKFCMRCGKPGTQKLTATEETWTCVDHGVIYKSALPQAETKAAKPETKAPQAEAAAGDGKRALN